MSCYLFLAMPLATVCFKTNSIQLPAVIAKKTPVEYPTFFGAPDEKFFATILDSQLARKHDMVALNILVTRYGFTQYSSYSLNRKSRRF